MTGKPARKPMGRPPLPPGEAKLHALGLRTDLANYQAVQEWAAKSGKSVAQELERAIEYRRWFEDLFTRLFEGPLRRPNITMISTFENAGKASARYGLPDSEPATWLPDERCYRNALAETVMAMLENGPEGFSETSNNALFQVIKDHLFSRTHSGFGARQPGEPNPAVTITFNDETGEVVDARSSSGELRVEKPE
jgi:hypothetical protein